MQPPDYSSYSFRELYEALDQLRGDLYPQAIEALEAEIDSRTDVDKAMLEEAYFRVNRERFPHHERQLRERVEALGGFDSIAPETVTEDNRFKTGWRRVWAMFFDIVIFQLLILGPLVAAIQRGREDDLALQAVLSYATQLAVIFYFVLMHAACGQTLGKMITGVRVVKNSDFTPIALHHALLRDLVPLLFVMISIFGLPFFDITISEGEDGIPQLPGIFIAIAALYFAWPVLEVVTMLFNRRRRAVHDFMAGTVVIRYLRSNAKTAKTSAQRPVTEEG